MRTGSIRYGALFLACLFVLGLFSTDADAQKRRRRRTTTTRTSPKPVVTNPDIAPPGSEGDSATEERVISTAEETTEEAAAAAAETTTPKKKTVIAPVTETPEMQQTIDALSNQVNRLNDKLTKMQETERERLDMERLTRAEQRAESLRIQQVDVESKLADLQAKLEQVEYALKPENIERATAGYGTTRPEEARDTRKRQLENERGRLQAQIRILETSRQRLEASVRTADAEVDALRRRLEQQQMQDEAGTPRTEPAPTTNRRRPEQE